MLFIYMVAAPEAKVIYAKSH